MPNHPTRNWSAELKDFRKKHALTRDALGKYLGMSVNGLYQIESGKRQPRNPELLRRALEHLGAELRYLLKASDAAGSH